MTIAPIASTTILSYYRPGFNGKLCSLVCLLCETSATIFFVSFILIGTMKVRINNRILDFFGSISLEIYLVHRFFLIFLNSEYVMITNKVLYLSAGFGGTIFAAIILNKLDEVVVQAINGKIRIDKNEGFRA